MRRLGRTDGRGIHLHLRMHILCELHQGNEFDLPELRRRTGQTATAKSMMPNAVTKVRRARLRGLPILLVFAVFVTHAHGQATHFECTRRIDTSDLKLLLNDVAAANPRILDRLRADPALRLQQVLNLRELLAYACEAVKNGALKDPLNRAEL